MQLFGETLASNKTAEEFDFASTVGAKRTTGPMDWAGEKRESF